MGATCQGAEKIRKAPSGKDRAPVRGGYWGTGHQWVHHEKGRERNFDHRPKAVRRSERAGIDEAEQRDNRDQGGTAGRVKPRDKGSYMRESRKPAAR